MERIETTILKNLIFNEEYFRKVLPFIKGEYFESVHEKVTFEEIAKFIIEYGNLPSKEAIVIESEKRTDISDEGFKDISTLVTDLNEEKSDLQWLFDTTENGVEIVRSILHSLNQLVLLMVRQKRKKLEMLFHLYCQMH